MKKTDKNDAKVLAEFLEKNLLPEVRMKNELQAKVASLTQTREKLVQLRTVLKNKINNFISLGGVRSVWQRQHDLETFQKRLKALDTGRASFSESQLQALEKAKEEKWVATSCNWRYL